MKKDSYILAIESSCDDTAASVVSASAYGVHVHSNIISSQIALHTTYGGVVPNLAGREHAKNILPVVTKAMEDAHVSRDDIEAIAVTAGPGLMPALVIGVSSANALAYAWDKPLLPIHHIEGHIYANWIEDPERPRERDMQFPLLSLIVSGGHTQLVLMRDHFSYEIIGETQDDAVGEAYDKAARLLGLSYPGGPEIDKRALTYARDTTDTAEKDHYKNLLPRPMLHSGDYHFSFSGLKTAVLYAIRDYRKEHELAEKSPLPEEFVRQMWYAFQEAAVAVITEKTVTAAKNHAVVSLLLAGGVSANTHLRTALTQRSSDDLPTVTLSLPSLTYCLDNAAMIGAAATMRLRYLHEEDVAKLTTTTVLANPNLTLTSPKSDF